MDANQASGYDPEYVAKEIVNSIALEEDEIVIAKFHHTATVYLRRLLPQLLFRILELREAINEGTFHAYVATLLPSAIRPPANHPKAD